MSNADLNAFEKQRSLLSYTDTKPETASQKIFTLMDANPVYSNGVKWSREELYER